MANFQALFYSKAERALAERLERLLFDLGFEAVSLSRPNLPAITLPTRFALQN